MTHTTLLVWSTCSATTYLVSTFVPRQQSCIWTYRRAEQMNSVIVMFRCPTALSVPTWLVSRFFAHAPDSSIWLSRHHMLCFTGIREGTDGNKRSVKCSTGICAQVSPDEDYIASS